ncbi:hypothetical protein M4I32_13255 [Microbacterium sp. LRZ72]|uniref:restriction endonuclease subunit S n=1 Tax=Microbacterium sp. LRZ72 TaxID=2942481 RepID=UPI0029B432DF|nr:hypothetical protein [Microbacterium sp. LRZ72]MDX2377768.1 hypothetical protein [Microbacterium sp. LRZ72]
MRHALDRTVRRSASLVAHALSIASAGDRTRLGTIADIQGGIQKQPKRKPAHNIAPFLRVANVTASGLDLRDVHQIEVFAGDRDRYGLIPGDLLVVEGNGSASQIGRASLWDGSIPGAVHQNHLIRVRPSKTLIPAYLEAVWNSPQNRDTLTNISSSSSGLHTLSVGKLKALEIPVPSIERQASAIAQVDAIRDACSQLTSSAGASQQQSASLRRALFAAAFSGKLTGAASDSDVIEELAVIA